MANVRNLPISSAPFLSPEDSDMKVRIMRDDVPADTDPHYFPATKNFFCPALLGIGAQTKYEGSPYQLLQNDYEIQKVSPSRRTFWDDEKRNANRLRTRRTAEVENKREVDYKGTYEDAQFGPNSDQLGDLHQSWVSYYHDWRPNESCGPWDKNDPNTISGPNEVNYSKIPKCKKTPGIETNFSNLKRMKNCYYERKKEDDRLKRKCKLDGYLDTYCRNNQRLDDSCPPGCREDNGGFCRADLEQWQRNTRCFRGQQSIWGNNWPDCCNTYFTSEENTHEAPLNALKTEMDECEKFIREAVNADYENEKDNLKSLNLCIIPYPGQHENYLFKYIRNCGERKNLLSHIEFTPNQLKRLANKYNIVIDETNDKINLRNRISKKLWDSDEYMSKVYDELVHVCDLPPLPLIEIDDKLISSHRDIDQLWDKWKKNQRKLKRYMSQVEKQFAVFKILEKIEKPNTRENFFDKDTTKKPTKFKIKDWVWEEFLRKFVPDIDDSHISSIFGSLFQMDIDLVLMGPHHLPKKLFNKWKTEKEFNKLKTKTDIEMDDTINNIVDKIKEKLFPKATILEDGDEDEDERKAVDLWDLWEKYHKFDNLKEKFKFIQRKIGKTLDPPTEDGIKDILHAFIGQTTIQIDGQHKIPTARNVEDTLLRHRYFKNNPAKIHLTGPGCREEWKATQMRNLLEEMPYKGLLECYDNKIRKNQYVDAIWEYPEGTVNRRQNPQ